MEVEQPVATSATQRLWEAIEQRQDELFTLVAELVRRPSELGHEREAQEFVADHLAASGLLTEVWDLDSKLLSAENAGNSGVPFTHRPNVAGVLRGTGGGRALILNGHIDVVSPEPVAAWRHDPWAATVIDGLMYGRGAYDMKSGIALNLFLPRLINDLGLSLGGDLIVQSVIEEECTGNGALAASRRYSGDAAIVTEPTAGAFIAAHVGVMWFRVAIEGKSWHAMQAHRGVNAILKARAIIDALVALEDRMNAAPTPAAFAAVEHPINLNIGVIRGGDWPSTVPGSCELHCRLCFYPGQSVAEIRSLVEAAVKGASDADPWLREHPPHITYDGFQSAGSEVGVAEPMVSLLGAWHHAVTGGTMAPVASPAINDMRYFNFAEIPAGCYGARGGNGHAADEWLDLASLVMATKVVGAFALQWCGVVE